MKSEKKTIKEFFLYIDSSFEVIRLPDLVSLFWHVWCFFFSDLRARYEMELTIKSRHVIGCRFFFVSSFTDR